MRGNLAEQAALREAGFITFFFEPRWNNQGPFVKSAVLLKWWPVIQETIATAKPGQFFEIPFNWQSSSLVEVTPPQPRRKPGRPKKTATEETQTGVRPKQ
jgi:hypothetical protein